MKQLIICISILLTSLNVFCQNNNKITNAILNTNVNNEMRINVAMYAIGLPELSYERYISNNMGAGLSASASVEKPEDSSVRYITIPYYRVYFGSKKASGFFIEGNMIAVWERKTHTNFEYNSDYGYSTGISQTKVISPDLTTSFGYSTAIGHKFLTRHGLLGELCLGLGRLHRNNQMEPFPRIGVCMGKRF